MIANRYLAQHIYKGSFMVLLILVSLSLFFTMIREIDELGKGGFHFQQLMLYLFYKAPSMIVDFMPLAALIGSILSLGNLAGNIEIIALQASGFSLRRLILAVIMSAMGMALVAILVAEFIVPDAQSSAYAIKKSSTSAKVSLQSRWGVWIKDQNNLIFINRLFPEGRARKVRISEFDNAGKLQTVLQAKQARIIDQGWLLEKVSETRFGFQSTEVQTYDSLLYRGDLSEKLLTSLVIDPEYMSIQDLSTYVSFLDSNALNSEPESLALWQKLYSPITTVVMAVLAIPFVLGSQRQGNSGQRIVIGILLGLVFFVMSRLLIQSGQQFNVPPMLNALLPILAFLLLTVILIIRKIRNPA